MAYDQTPENLLIQGSRTELSRFFSLLPAQTLFSLPDQNIYLIRVPDGFNADEFRKHVLKEIPGLLVETNQKLHGLPEMPANFTASETQTYKDWKSALDNRLGIPKRKVAVAVVDSGVSAHEDLPLVRPLSNQDKNGHGTHVAGILAAIPDNGRGIDGVSTETNLRSYSVLGRHGEGRLIDLVATVVQACRDGNEIINLSLGTKEHSQILYDVLTTVGRKCILVAASGNDSTDRPFLPASHPLVIGVGSVGKDGAISSFSNYGINVKISQIGEDVLSTWPGNSYKMLSGTSMAAPKISGFLAEALSRIERRPDPSLILDAVQRHKQRSVTVLQDPNSTMDPSLFAYEISNAYKRSQGLTEDAEPDLRRR